MILLFFSLPLSLSSISTSFRVPHFLIKGRLFLLIFLLLTYLPGEYEEALFFNKNVNLVGEKVMMMMMIPMHAVPNQNARNNDTNKYGSILTSSGIPQMPM